MTGKKRGGVNKKGRETKGIMDALEHSRLWAGQGSRTVNKKTSTKLTEAKIWKKQTQARVKEKKAKGHQTKNNRN